MLYAFLFIQPLFHSMDGIIIIHTYCSIDGTWPLSIIYQTSELLILLNTFDLILL